MCKQVDETTTEEAGQPEPEIPVAKASSTLAEPTWVTPESPAPIPNHPVYGGCVAASDIRQMSSDDGISNGSEALITAFPDAMESSIDEQIDLSPIDGKARA